MGNPVIYQSFNMMGTYISDNSNHYCELMGEIKFDTTEANKQIKMKAAGTFTNLYTNISYNARSGSDTQIVLRVNGSTTALANDYGLSGSGVMHDSSHSVSVSAGDLVCLALITPSGAGSSSVQLAWAVIEFTASTGTVSHFVMNFNPGVTMGFASAVRGPWAGWTGGYVLFPGNTTAGYQYSYNAIVVPATLSNLRVRCASQSMNVNPTFTLWKNGSATSLQVTLTGAGWFEDTTHSVSVTTGDYIEWVLDSTGRTSGSLGVDQAQVAVTGASGAGFDMFAAVSMQNLGGYTGGTGTGSVEVEQAMGPVGDTAVTYESNIKLPIPFAATATYWRASGSTPGYATFTFYLRKNGSNVSGNVTFPSGVGNTLFTDTTDSDSFSAGDYISAGWTGPASNPVTAVSLISGVSFNYTPGGGGPTWDHNPVMVNSN